MRQFLASLILLTTSALPSFAWDIDKMNEQIEATNVIVSEICSGTIINAKERLVLTAHHCITDNLKEESRQEVDPKTGEVRTVKVQKKTPMYIEKWYRQGGELVSKETHIATIKGYSKEYDIAILQVDNLLYAPKMEAPLAPENFPYKRGTTVFAVGNPGILFDDTVTQGIISHPLRSLEMGDNFTIPFFQHSASIIGGSSGGAIYNDSGEIIGTVSAGVRGADIGLAVPISKTKDLLKSIGY
jgi:S1-C subfamily serine protease